MDGLQEPEPEPEREQKFYPAGARDHQAGDSDNIPEGTSHYHFRGSTFNKRKGYNFLPAHAAAFGKAIPRAGKSSTKSPFRNSIAKKKKSDFETFSEDKDEAKAVEAASIQAKRQYNLDALQAAYSANLENLEQDGADDTISAGRLQVEKEALWEQYQSDISDIKELANTALAELDDLFERHAFAEANPKEGRRGTKTSDAIDVEHLIKLAQKHKRTARSYSDATGILANVASEAGIARVAGSEFLNLSPVQEKIFILLANLFKQPVAKTVGHIALRGIKGAHKFFNPKSGSLQGRILREDIARRKNLTFTRAAPTLKSAFEPLPSLDELLQKARQREARRQGKAFYEPASFSKFQSQKSQRFNPLTTKVGSTTGDNRDFLRSTQYEYRKINQRTGGVQKKGKYGSRRKRRQDLPYFLR